MITSYYESKLCLCGCGKTPNTNKKFISGHNLKGRKFSEIHKKKIGDAQRLAWANGRIKPTITFYGKICKNCHNVFFIKSEGKARMFCSNSCFRKYWSISHMGENNNMYGMAGDLSPNWLGGISFAPYSKNFNSTLKYLIRKRDNYECQLCSKKENGRKHHIHHIDYNKLNFTSLNLISLCISCHMKTNYKRKKWIQKLKFLMASRHTIQQTLDF